MKVLYVGLVLFFNGVYTSAIAQGPNWLWAESAVGADGSYGSVAITADADGNVYVTGDFIDSISFGNITLSHGRVFIVKYDFSGNVVWAKSNSGNTYSIGNAITADANGDVYMTGFSEGDITFGNDTLKGGGYLF